MQMPRVPYFLAALVPLVAVFLVIRSFDTRTDFLKVVAARIGSTWPFALHPDATQQPLIVEDVLWYPHKGDGHKLSSVHNAHGGQGKTYGQVASSEPTFTRRIVAVGDLHGDLPNAHKVLRMAGVVDEENNWSGGADIFVQTGDIIDRGDDTIKLYMWMEQLRSQAQAKGGTVLSHLGNHEWMNLIGDWRYVYPSEIKTFGSAEARFKMITKGRIGKAWAQNYTTTTRLPLHPSLGPPNTDYDPESLPASSPLSHSAISFVHGGLAPQYHDLTPFPSRINDIGHSLLRKLQTQTPPPPHPPNPYPGLPHDATHAEQRLYAGDGPLWYRGWALEPEEKVCAQVDDVLNRTGTRRMVMGHTPNFRQIVSRCDGKIIIIDTGISHAYGGALSALSIDYTLTPLADASSAVHGVKSWTEREVVSAVYEDKVVTLADDKREISGDFA
ncbi:Metallo-dependent phosphatase [Panus rudis PR-1116 ss-1]|nr:Metallo-dependent phosphatase [Panus rudis PR-1116 ss-1]